MLKTLYKQNKNQSIQYCKITTNSDTFTVEWGQINSQKPQFKTTKCLPKNIHRANQTTGAEQALLESQALHASKIKANYTTNPDGVPTETRILAMKVKDYSKNQANVDFTNPVYCSPKLDGVNCIFKLEDNLLTMYSRGGEKYNLIPHLIKPVLEDLARANTDELNCELYAPSLHLQQISAATKKHNENTPLLQAHVFDYPNINKPFKDKISTLLNSELPHPSITEGFTHDDIETQHTEAISAGYEGIVIRNACLTYQHGKRSSNAFKMKIQLDTERKVIDYTLDKNNHVVWLVGDKDGNKTFKLKMIGTNEERLKMASEADSYIGKWMNLKFESFSMDQICLKPVGQYFRKVNNTTGEAAE